MDKRYTVKLMPRAYHDLDESYCYIADESKEIGTAECIVTGSCQEIDSSK